METMYPWFKALHIIAVISWMAGLLYLPRLFINHVGLAPGSEASNMLKGMEQRLLRYIMRPAGLATFIFGGLLLQSGVVDWSMGWMHAKLALVLGLGYIHGKMEIWCKAFAADANTKSTKFYRVINEVPTVLMIGIVVLVVAKPF